MPPPLIAPVPSGCLHDAALWTAAPGKTIMCFQASERPDASTFRHAHHEFPVTIKAVVFDAYGALMQGRKDRAPITASSAPHAYCRRCSDCPPDSWRVR